METMDIVEIPQQAVIIMGESLLLVVVALMVNILMKLIVQKIIVQHPLHNLKAIF